MDLAPIVGSHVEESAVSGF